MKPKLITTFVILIFSAVFVFLFVLPKFEELGNLRDRFSKQKNETEQIKSKFETTRQAILQFERLTAKDIELVNLALPDESDLPDLLVLVDLLIARAGLIGEDINISFSESKEQKPAVLAPATLGAIAPKFLIREESSGRREANINFSAIGSYESFKAFLGQLEKSSRIFDLTSVSFATTKISEKISGSFRFGVSIKTYYSQ